MTRPTTHTANSTKYQTCCLASNQLMIHYQTKSMSRSIARLSVDIYIYNILHGPNHRLLYRGSQEISVNCNQDRRHGLHCDINHYKCYMCLPLLLCRWVREGGKDANKQLMALNCLNPFPFLIRNGNEYTHTSTE